MGDRPFVVKIAKNFDSEIGELTMSTDISFLTL